MSNSLKSLIQKSKEENNKEQKPVETAPNKPKANPFNALKEKTKQKHTLKEKEELANIEKKKEPEPKAPPKEEPTDIAVSDNATSVEERLQDEFNHDLQKDGADTDAVEKLKHHLEVLQENMTNKEMVADSISFILNHVQQHDFLRDILHPEDCGLMVRALRESYGTTIAKKQKRSNKRQVTQKSVEETMDLISDVEINI